MARANFAAVRSKITNTACDSCGNDKWDVIEATAKGDAPGIQLFPADGNKTDAPLRIPTALTVCQNCGNVRLYALKKAS